MTKRILILSLLLLAFLVLAMPAQPQDAVEGGTLIMMQSADVIAWDQTRTTWPSIRNVRPLYDTLLTVDDNDNLLPFLATDWEISEDGLEYTFYLRDDVMFHDGTPWNADAVIFNYQRQLDDPRCARSRALEQDSEDGSR